MIPILSYSYRYSFRNIKIPPEEINHDDAINNTESISVGTDRKEVLNRLQTAFAREFERSGKLKESGIRPMNYTRKQAWTTVRKMNNLLT